MGPVVTDVVVVDVVPVLVGPPGGGAPDIRKPPPSEVSATLILTRKFGIFVCSFSF